MSVPAAIRFGRVNRGIQNIVKTFHRQSFDAAKYIQPFFTATEYAELRKLQQSTGAILSGEPVDRFFDRWPIDGELIIITKTGSYTAIRRWLRRIGYAQKDETAADLPDKVRSTVRQIPIATRKWRYGRAGLTLHLITATQTPVEVILNFYSTSFMNFWTDRNAYSLYPGYTFDEHFAIRNLTGRSNDTVDSVKRRCLYNVCNMPHAAAIIHESSPFAGGFFRFVGDNKCCIRPLQYHTKHRDRREPITAHSWDYKVGPVSAHISYSLFPATSSTIVCFSEYELSAAETSLHSKQCRAMLASGRKGNRRSFVRCDASGWTLTSSIFDNLNGYPNNFTAHTAQVLMELCRDLLLKYEMVHLIQHEVNYLQSYITAVISVSPNSENRIATYEYNDILNFLLKKRINIRLTWPHEP
ncbi:hypothetical protein GYMLUDRAFT_253097 [Collybiopsis luxurians FD-317 M1]|uniref:Uncharacterized protein n=1 Tax=Collybiopsis luxurians FD-317 M1 TaxID=944289 RepID=A0A0D0C6F9_9AGAR|nr:hypothetical protein GYMLUDRAFT_253097 [Collybiopsis luxurians FD-317 M1]